MPNSKLRSYAVAGRWAARFGSQPLVPVALLVAALVSAGCGDSSGSRGSAVPTPTHSPIATATVPPSVTPTATSAPADTATVPVVHTATPTATLAPSETATFTRPPDPSATPTPTSVPSETPTQSPSHTATPTDTVPPTSTPTPTQTPTQTNTATPTATCPPEGCPLLTGTPVAGMAEGFVDFPVGAPLGGYTARCRCFGDSGRYDARRNPYITRFNPSIGVQTQPKVVALWLDNGWQDLVLLKTDAIYVFEGMVTAIERRLSEATGRNLAGRVTLAANHTHAAPANWDQGLTWYLGGDRFNREVFERAVSSMTEIALDAWNTRQPAALGVGQVTDWDPFDRIYSDRRGENNQTQFFDDIPAGSYKDPYLTVLRVDTAAGDPIGMFFAFGMHGTIASDSNQLWSVEASGHIESAVEERFSEPVFVGYLQHGGGDASPRGVDREFARMESIGELAADIIYDLWSETETSAEPIRLETVTRSLDTRRDVIKVEREYDVLTYAPYDPDPGFSPDDVIYDEEGRILTPIDEFNTEAGGAFCGSDNPLLPAANIGSSVYPYNSCVEVSLIANLIGAFFSIPNVELPLPESLRAKISATRLGPIPILTHTGEIVHDDVLLAFFPGEATAVYTEQFRRRAAEQLGMHYTIPIAYSQDHQGYLLTPEDWLLGGYEPNINLWGPLHGEHIMEGLLTAAAEVLTTNRLEAHDPTGEFADPVYPEVPLPEFAPDLTPDAGTALAALPSYFLIPIEGLAAEVAPPAAVRRAQDIVQFMWEGGDPGVDLPVVVLERLDADTEAWEEFRTAAGRPLISPRHDMILATTPEPLAPFTAPQKHYWWVAWQAVGHVHDRLGLPVGTYRLRVDGQTYLGGVQTWPWPAAGYSLVSPSFEVVPAEISLTRSGTTLTGWVQAHARGFRLVDVAGNSRGPNPIRNATIRVHYEDGSEAEVTPVLETIATQRTQWSLDATDLDGATAIAVVDAYGNAGTLAID